MDPDPWTGQPSSKPDCDGAWIPNNVCCRHVTARIPVQFAHIRGQQDSLTGKSHHEWEFQMRCLILLLAVLLAGESHSETSGSGEKKTTSSLVLPVRRDVPGKQFKLPVGELYVPDTFDPSLTTGTELCVFFLGAGWVTRQNYHEARINAPLVTVTLGSLGEYRPAFESPSAFQSILESVSSTLAEEGITTAPVARICLASFSGGYSAVREILSQPQYSALITDVLLADSLYPSKLKGEPDRIDPASIKPFADFAVKAAAGLKTMWYTQLFPPKPAERGNTTTLAAEYLVKTAGAEQKWFLGTGPTSEPTTSTLHSDNTETRNAPQRCVLYRADKGNFHVVGYAGMTMQDHMEHFYRAAELFRNSSLTTVPKNGVTDSAR
jgi:hypothetical protein